MTRPEIRVLIAGIGGASLGTELLKALTLAGDYRIFACDISPLAYGHYVEHLEASRVVSRDNYVCDVLDLCREYEARAVIPGGEEPMILLSSAADELKAAGVFLASNSPDVVRTCADKSRLFEQLQRLNVDIPRTVQVIDVDDFEDVGYPCIVKAATGTGGSNLVFLAADRTEATLYLSHILRIRPTAVLQEYVPLDEGEFTIGVLATPDGLLRSSIALQRLFHSKLSWASKTAHGLISSGYSQGLIAPFESICRQAEGIAAALHNRGPMNIQARVREGRLLPFEINPRFSASSYLRAMAGCNEIDSFLRSALLGETPAPGTIRSGYYLRSLSEVYVPCERVVS